MNDNKRNKSIHLRAAIVEDSRSDADTLCNVLSNYIRETKYDLSVKVFSSATAFLQNYGMGYDLIFMDIEMPEMDGMSAARILRETDKRVGLIFITNMPQYAINGYEVSALDYLIKPVTIPQLNRTLNRVLPLCEPREEKPYLMLPDEEMEQKKVLVGDIYYIVKEGNYLVYYTKSGTQKTRGTMRDLEKQLEGSKIIKCANGCMVNLRHVIRKSGNDITVNDGNTGITLAVTKPYRQQLVEALMRDIRENR